MDKIGDFSWTFLVTSRGQNVHEKSSFWVNFRGHLFGDFSWTFLVNFRGHFLNSNAITKPNPNPSEIPLNSQFCTIILLRVISSFEKSRIYQDMYLTQTRDS